MKLNLKVGDRVKIDEGVDYDFTVGTITDFPKRKDKGNNTILTLFIEESSICPIGNKVVFWLAPEELSKVKILN